MFPRHLISAAPHSFFAENYNLRLSSVWLVRRNFLRVKISFFCFLCVKDYGVWTGETDLLFLGSSLLLSAKSVENALTLRTTEKRRCFETWNNGKSLEIVFCGNKQCTWGRILRSSHCMGSNSGV